jgi:iron complex outermembrane receptor protein
VPGGPTPVNLGRYANLYPTPRWKHLLSLDWSLGAWNVYAANRFQLHYLDASASQPSTTTPGLINSVVPGTPGSTWNYVASSSTYDLQLGYVGFKNVKLNLGVVNLFNTAPPTSNQAGYFRGFDQTVDATGRYCYASMSYAFK